MLQSVDSPVVECWYMARVRKKSYLSHLRSVLRQLPYEYHFIEDIPSAHVPAICNLVADKFAGELLIKLPADKLSDFSKEHAEWLRINRTKGGLAIIYTDADVMDFLHFLRLLDRPIVIAPSLPAGSVEFTVPVGTMQGVCGKLYTRRNSGLRLYIDLLGRSCVYLLLDKLTERGEINKPSLQFPDNTPKWMVLLTYNEEGLAESFAKWNARNAERFSEEQHEPCEIYLPRRWVTGKDGKMKERLLCRGYLFIRSSLSNLSNLEEVLPNIGYHLLRYRNSEGMWCMRTIDAHHMNTFMLVNDSRNDWVQYEDYEFVEGQKVVLNCSEHSFHGREGTLVRKKGKMYVVFTIPNLQMKRLPEVEVTSSQIRVLKK